MEKFLNHRPLLSGNVTELRRQFTLMRDMLKVVGLSPPEVPSVRVCDDIANGVKVRVYTPEVQREKEIPLGVYFHGGGYLMGDLDTEDEYCRYIAKETPCIIVSVDYRLAPEHQLPAMLEDGINAFKWVDVLYK